MKNIIKAIVALTLTACSGGTDEVYLDSPDGGELGQAQQGQTIKPTTTLTFGASTASAGLACNNSNGGQVCSMPSSKEVKYAILGGGSPSTRTRTQLQAVMLQLQGAGLGNGWIFNEVTQASANLTFSITSCGTTGSSNIENYVCLQTRTGGAVLTDTLPGTYRTHDKSFWFVDISDIDAKGANATEDDRILKHGVGHALLAHMGRGARTDVATAYSRRAVSPIQDMTAFAGGELCTMNGYQLTPAGSLTVGSGCGGD